MRCSTSLWSADLSRLADEITRVEPYSERFHLDVADGHYVPELLFFPSLVSQLRPLTARPFEVHLMTTDPDLWIDPFVDAGADVVIVALDSTDDPRATLQAIRARGKEAGLSLLLDEEIDLLDPLWDLLDIVTIAGTEIGIKGASMDPRAPVKVQKARAAIDERGLSTIVQADGGIRRQTVPLLHDAGADYIVPGSLMFGEEPAEMRAWLAAL